MLPDAWVSVVTNGQYSMKWACFRLFSPFKKKKKKCFHLKPASREAGRLEPNHECCSYVVQASTIQGTHWIWILLSITLFNTLPLLLCVAVIVVYPRCFPTHNRKHNWHKTVHGHIQTDRLAFVIYPAHSCTYRKCSIYKMKAESSTDSA